jgi:cytochrome P450
LAVVLEALRCYPPAYLVGRCANRDVELGGRYALPAGTTVLVRWAGVKGQPGPLLLSVKLPG